MKSIKEKAAEYRKVLKVINENESIVDTKGSEMFEQGANYVIEEIEPLIDTLRSGARKLFEEKIKELKK